MGNQKYRLDHRGLPEISVPYCHAGLESGLGYPSPSMLSTALNKRNPKRLGLNAVGHKCLVMGQHMFVIMQSKHQLTRG